MKYAPIPDDEEGRLAVVQSFGVLDTPAEERFDRITRAAVQKLHMPISTITIMDRNREWYKSCIGTPERQGSRDTSFCGHAMLQRQIFVIEDTTLDPRFVDNPQVTGPMRIRFYAGVALHDLKTHRPIGAFCVKDTKPRQMSTEELGWVLDFAKQAEKELNRGRK